MRYLIWACQFVLLASLGVIPLLWTDDLAVAKRYPFLFFWKDGSFHLNVPLTVMALVVLLLVLLQVYEKKREAQEAARLARQAKELVGDREFIEAYASAVKDSINAAYLAHGMRHEQRIAAQADVLKSIRSIVRKFYDDKQDLEINACLMLAYSIASAPGDIESRLRFKEKKRDLRSYSHVLDLVLWAEDRPDLPKALALPVDDPCDPEARFKVLPGAPYAFAFDRPAVIQDTSDLDSYFNNQGKYIDLAVRQEQMLYFGAYSFKSFASLPVKREGEKIGVLNVQSNKVNIMGEGNENGKLVTDLLDPLKQALALLCVATESSPMAS
jgi:hypothetical protein